MLLPVNSRFLSRKKRFLSRKKRSQRLNLVISS
jgi:hypothetical protein